MPSDLSNYLATHYLTADPKPSKKRKRKPAAADTGLLITDDSETGWARKTGGDDDEDNVATVAGTSAEFRKAKKSSWKVVGAPVPAKSQDETAEADAILASAAAEQTARAGEADDEAPAVMMSDGTHAGLQSAAAVSAQLEKRRKQERAEWEKMAGKQDKEAETIYRDATGRRVDAAMKRAEARRQLAEAAEKEERQKDLRGEVQKEEARRRREELEEVKLMGVARHADDEELNREMKAKTRWGDTMAEYVGRDKNGGGGCAASGGKRLKGRPVYQGAAPPNRYNIRPGYRWDGVDRSNGFEAERFKAMNRVERNKGLEYSWQMDE